MKKLDLVFLWHMHQPDYRDHGATGGGDVGATGEFVLPWVYLHAMKDYVDMAAHLERHPQIRCVVNFVPVLLDQIEDYAQQFASGRFRDPLLRMLATHRPGADRRSRAAIAAGTCFRSNHVTMLAPFPHYQRLHDLYQVLTRGKPDRQPLSVRRLLLGPGNLVSPGVDRRKRAPPQPAAGKLMSQGEGYDANDRKLLLDSIGELICGLIPRWRALAARGQVELSSTPQTHPLSPLLLDFRSCTRKPARRAAAFLPRPTPAVAAASSPISRPRASATPGASAPRRWACGRPKGRSPKNSSAIWPRPAAAGSPAARRAEEQPGRQRHRRPARRLPSLAAGAEHPG
jgi:alpha-amylase/alpha-mannosidase (GH57 family)